MYSLTDKESKFLLRRLYGENITVGYYCVHYKNDNLIYL